MTNIKLKSRVLCFPSILLDELGRFQGICTDVSAYFPNIIEKPNFQFVEREVAESSFEYKQVIPYVILLYKDKVFSYRRGKSGSESSLHELYSVGLGGHIEDNDTLLWSSDEVGYKEALLRELFEEVSIDSDYEESCTGLINDDSDNVGRLHFGLVHIVKLANKKVKKRESVITDAGFISIQNAIKNIVHYETWSQFCLKNIESLISGGNK